MTTRFVSAANLMCRVLGVPGFAYAVIDHPISSASDERLAEYARATIEQARRILLKPPEAQ
jgi:transaldolase